MPLPKRSTSPPPPPPPPQQRQQKQQQRQPTSPASSTMSEEVDDVNVGSASTLKLLHLLGYSRELIPKALDDAAARLIDQLLEDLVLMTEAKKEQEQNLAKSQDDNLSLLHEVAKQAAKIKSDEKELERLRTESTRKKLVAAEAKSQRSDGDKPKIITTNDDLDEEVKSLKDQVRKLQSLLMQNLSKEDASGGNKLIEDALKEALTRVDKLEMDLEKTQQNLSLAQGECKRLTSVAGAASLRTEELESQLRSLEQKIFELNKDVLREQNALKLQKEKCAGLEMEADDLKIQIAKMEGGNDSLAHRLDQQKLLLTQEQDAKRKVEEMLKHAREETHLCEERLVQNNRNLKEYQSKYAAMEVEVSAARDQVLRLNQERLDAVNEKSALENNVEVFRRQIQSQTAALSERDGDVRELKDKLRIVQEELKVERAALETNRVEIRTAAQDIANMTRENQLVNEACDKLIKEKNKAIAKFEEAQSRGARLQGFLDTLKMEKAEMQDLYKRACSENSQLTAALKDAARNNTVREEEFHALNASLGAALRKNAELEQACSRYKLDVEHGERAVQNLSRDLRAARGELNEVAEAKKAADRERQSVVFSAEDRLKENEALVWELDQTRGELSRLVARVEKMSQENDALSKELGRERVRVREMEVLVERAREGEAKALLLGGGTALKMKPSSFASPASSNSSSSSSAVVTPNRNQAVYDDLNRIVGGDLLEASNFVRGLQSERSSRTSFVNSSSSTGRKI